MKAVPFGLAAVAVAGVAGGLRPAISQDKGLNPAVSSKQVLAAKASDILRRRCFQCHGADAISGLDLRTHSAALRGGKRGPAIVPGQPEKSPLYQFVAGKGAALMPPAGALHPNELALLRQWIQAGAPWMEAEGQKAEGRSQKAGAGGGKREAAGQFWSLRPVRKPPLPQVRNRAWVRNPVDAFVLAKLEASGLAPAPPAGRRELIRRLSFDLTGLPPTPEEVDAFVRDARPDAYERLVDRLLASPHYGERWARHWLDVVRFAESQGFERDKIREHAWRYRDYVIDAFNRDKPYDRFIKEQIAGDLLPAPPGLPGANAAHEGIIATGFLVAGPWDEVGNNQASQVMRARVREDELEDIVSATAQTFLGLTVNCARCHDHKFDPIPQRDYYRFQAALAGVRHGDRPVLTTAEQRASDEEKASLKSRLDQVNAAIARIESAARARVAARHAKEKRPRSVPNDLPSPLLRWTFEEGTTDTERGIRLELKGGANLRNGRLLLDGMSGRALSSPLPFAVVARTLEAWVALGSLDQRGGSVLTLEDLKGNLFDGIVFGERQPRKWISGSSFFSRTRDLEGPEETAGPDELVHLAITYAEDDRITVYRNGKIYAPGYVPVGAADASLRRYAERASRVLLGLRHSAGATPGGNRWFKGEIEEARVYARALTAEEVSRSFQHGPPTITEAEIRAALTDEELREHTRLNADSGRIRGRLTELDSPPMAYAALSKEPEPVHLLERGDVQKKAERVSPAGLSCIGDPSADFGLSPEASDAQRRLRLAEWIAHPANPLTPRVMVNRVWQYHFGQGIVGTPSDFGVMGERPTHPELLDYLASVFAGPNPRPLAPNPAEGMGWSLKKLHRFIVTSSTYRQSTKGNEKAAALDVDNRLLWRMSPRRLEAEEIRDAVLSVSGKLNPKRGGPGFRPFSVTVSNSHFYTYEDRVGPEYERRSIYRTVVNSGGIPLLEVFDCPDPSVKTPRRSSTTTPLQALSLLNNSFVLRQTRELAARLEREVGADPARQVDRVYRLCFARPPEGRESTRAVAFVKEHGLPALCRVLFNTSEFVFVR